nr:SGNH/GDSL hydrolase family protein [Aneurinibacillus migulanus]
MENTLKHNKNHKQIIVENFGKRGSRTDGLLERLEQNTISSAIEDTDIVLITIGANDIMRIVRENFNHLTYEQFVNKQLRALAEKRIQQD